VTVQTVGRADGPYCKVASLYSRPFAARRRGRARRRRIGVADSIPRERGLRAALFFMQMKGFGKVALVFGLLGGLMAYFIIPVQFSRKRALSPADKAEYALTVNYYQSHCGPVLPEIEERAKAYASESGRSTSPRSNCQAFKAPLSPGGALLLELPARQNGWWNQTSSSQISITLVGLEARAVTKSEPRLNGCGVCPVAPHGPCIDPAVSGR